MTKDSNSRHWLLAAALQIGIRVRYLIESGFGLKPLLFPLSAYPSPWRPKECPDFSFLTRISFIWLYFTTGIARDTGILYLIFVKTGFIHVLTKFHQYLCDSLITSMKKKGYTSAKREVQIPEYDWKNGDAETFYQTFVKRPHPVVLRGFMDGKDVLKKLSFETILKNHGEEDVFLTKKEIDGYPGKLKEVENPKIYLHNSEKLFNKFPEMRKLFEYERLEPFLHMKAGYEQIFMGKEGTGSPFHQAAVYNMFYMVDGSKTWWFIDPYDTFLAYPVALIGRAANVLMCLWPGDYNKEAFPLFEYCPVYKTTLNPGDVLFNPPWWWHSIKNVTPTTVGVASRWHTDGIAGHNLVTTEEDYNIYTIGSFFFLAGKSSWSFLHNILQTPSPKFDEHVTLREKNNRYVHKQIEIHENGGLNALGVTTKF